MFLRFLINRSPIVLAGVGIAVVAMLGWFSYRYLYQSVAYTSTLAALSPPAPIEFIDEHRLEQLHTFFRDVDALPPIDPKIVRDVFSTAVSPTPIPVDVRRKP